MMEVYTKRFGSLKHKTIHSKKIKLSNGWHLKCKWLNCPGQIRGKDNRPNGICSSVIINNSITIMHCFCG